MTFAFSTGPERQRSLTDEQVLWMRAEFRKGRNGKSMAAELGVSKTTAIHAIRGISYRHLPDPVLLEGQVAKPPIAKARKHVAARRLPVKHVSAEREIAAAFMQWQGGTPRQDWRVCL